jgi:uracil-DNA glycosylase
MSICTLSKETYALEEKWYEFYDSNKSIVDIPYHPTWHVMFAAMLHDPNKLKKLNKINETLKKLIKDNKYLKIYPLPNYVFKAFMITRASDLKVVFIGQDPYFNCKYHDGKYVPEAMGLSFSVPHGIEIPSSLNNMYANLIKFGHIKQKPKSGNLWYWATQGCLMLNTALTVEDNNKKCHSQMWEWLTDYMISYISTYFDDIVFVLWGADAYKKNTLIDQDRHHIVVSSHPSGLSANKAFQNFPAFVNKDHFGEINYYLTKKGKSPILWD